MLAVFPFWLRENCPVGPVRSAHTEAPSDPSEGEPAGDGARFMFRIAIPVVIFQIRLRELLPPEN